MISVNRKNTTVSAFRKDDLLQHIEDTRLFWASCDGQPVQYAWNELSEVERERMVEAEERAAYVAMFAIYD